ncbi:ATP-binding domain-containing protein [Sporosarcina sp. ACRSL]|uniref:ATP-binding domain-containing protein n=1 Tax=Sporosarcina sp. ACRSL TaxID=2918215 RepID=UPI001EF5A80C|nr:ATP-binding domain-containing protein [Sporosarcina sp. ACRSL]MCG7344791.1 ATP-binding domain-containing protein [Sporosarcina sp. ACRSL]
MNFFKFLTTKRDDTSTEHQITEKEDVKIDSFPPVRPMVDVDTQAYLWQRDLEMKEQANQQLIANQIKSDELITEQSREIENLKGIIRQLEAKNAELSMRPTTEELAQKDRQVQQLAIRLKTVIQSHVPMESYEQAKQETVLAEQKLRTMTAAAEQLKAQADLLEVEVQSSTPTAIHMELEKKYAVLQMSHSLRMVENDRLAKRLDEMERKFNQLQQFTEAMETPASAAQEHAASVVDEIVIEETSVQDHNDKEDFLAVFEEAIAVQLELEEEELEFYATPPVLSHEQVVDQPMLAEKEIDEDQMLQSMSEVMLTTMSSLEETKVPEESKAPSFPAYSESSFLPRDDKSEYGFLRKVVSIIKSLMRPIRKIEFDSTYGVDYASAYAEGIMRKQSYEHNRRLQGVEDKPYVARVDYVTKNGPETMYIGEQSIDGYVTSWKAEAASLYYLRTVGQPISHKTLGDVIVDYIRQIDIRSGSIQKLHPPLTASSQYFQDEGLVSALSDKRGVDMQEIVATLQREQYEIIRLPMTKPIIIQGSAGSGKSAIALHRLSYLLFKYEDLSPERVAILGPNEAFLAHIKNVLPSLGDYGIKQTTFLNLACDILGLSPSGIKRHNVTELELIKTKGSLEFQAIVQRKTMGKFNDLRTWAKPVIADSIAVPILPILREMERYPDLSLKERENLYFNFFLKSVQKEMKERNEVAREWKQWVRDEAKQIEKQETASLSLFQTNFISERITELAEKWMNLAAAHAEESSPVTKKKVDAGRLQFIAAIQHAIQLKLDEHGENLKGWLSQMVDESLISEDWHKHMKRKMREEREVVLLQHIVAQREEVFSTARLTEDTVVKARLEEVQAQLLQEFAVEKQDFFERRKNQIQQALYTESLAGIERSYYRQISAALQREYNLQYSFNHQLSGFVFEEELALSAPEEKSLRNYVKKNLKADLFSCYEAAVQAAKDEGMLPAEHDSSSAMYYEDLPALLHIDRLLNGAPKNHLLSYLIVDEAQDYMPYEITELHALTRKNGIMLIGDLGQNLNQANTLQDWNVLGELIGDLSLHELKATYRSTAQIVEVSNEIIGPFASGKYSLSAETFREGNPVECLQFVENLEEKVLIHILEHAVYESKYEPVAVIVKDESQIERYHYMIDPYFSVAIQTAGTLPTGTKVVITTPSAVKGLEFEAVVITRFNEYAPTDEDRKLAYVATSRALHQLYMMVERGKSCLVGTVS